MWGTMDIPFPRPFRVIRSYRIYLEEGSEEERKEEEEEWKKGRKRD